MLALAPAYAFHVVCMVLGTYLVGRASAAQKARAKLEVAR
jgi:hypothetical protein